MKKSRLLDTVCIGVLIFISAASHAALIDRGSGMIYDTDLDITWLNRTFGPQSQYSASDAIAQL